jgi:hypothetical protein
VLWLSSHRCASGVRTAWPQRTKDYQQIGYENHLTSSCLCRKQTLYGAYTSWISGIMAQLLDRAPLEQVKNFHAKSSVTDLGLKHRTKHHHLSFVKVRVVHLLKKGYWSSRQQRRRIVVRRIIMYAQLSLGVASSNPTVSLGSTDGGGV